uniref:tRNA (guanine(46)-N(7))-methyltransferase n=1 Tax=Arcella intermedia TaxID=1963864 RepID=A0A6B2LFQ2_9EUKA
MGEMFPDTLSLGIEIRTKVVEYVKQRIDRLREENQGTTKYQNISVLNTNAMKYFPNHFYKGQLKKIFFLFPDPHFKKANHRRRIISSALLPEYAYLLAEGGKLYTVTDVHELYLWETACLDSCPLFERVQEEENQQDPVIPLILNNSEEAKKVQKANGQKWYAVYRKVEIKKHLPIC